VGEEKTLKSRRSPKKGFFKRPITNQRSPINPKWNLETEKENGLSSVKDRVSPGNPCHGRKHPSVPFQKMLSGETGPLIHKKPSFFGTTAYLLQIFLSHHPTLHINPFSSLP